MSGAVPLPNSAASGESGRRRGGCSPARAPEGGEVGADRAAERDVTGGGEATDCSHEREIIRDNDPLSLIDRGGRPREQRVTFGGK